jgi:hypothetical protein
MMCLPDFCFVFLLSHNSKTSWCIYFPDMSTKEGDTCQWQISIIFEYLKKKTTKLFFRKTQAQLCLTRPDPISSGTPFQASNKTRSKWIEKMKKRKRGWRNDWIRALTLSNYFFFFFVSIGSSNMRVFLYSSFRNFRRDFYFRTWTGWNRPPETKWKRRKRKRFFRLTQCWHGEEPSPPSVFSFSFLPFDLGWPAAGSFQSYIRNGLGRSIKQDHINVFCRVNQSAHIYIFSLLLGIVVLPVLFLSQLSVCMCNVDRHDGHTMGDPNKTNSLLSRVSTSFLRFCSVQVGPQTLRGEDRKKEVVGSRNTN